MIATTQMRALLGAMLLLLVAAPAASAAANDTTLASRANGAAGAKADGPAFESSMSTDGRYVVFATVATNLGGDTDPSTVDVYKRDRLLGNTVLVSQSTGGTYMNAADQGRYPSVSGDGRYVVFASNSTALDAADADTTFDIFLRDTQSNTTTLVSRATGAAGAKGDGASTNAVISENGRYVAFTSASTNLGADANAEPDVFVRDLQTDTTTLVSRATGAAGATSTPGTSSAVSAVSNDGRYVTFHTNESYNAADTNFADDVYVRDTTSDTTTLVSRADGAAGAVGNADSHFGSTSSDGRYVTFYSVATNLSADDADATEDVFVRDLAANVTKLVSRATGVAGVKGNNTSMNPVISANGKYIATNRSRRTWSRATPMRLPTCSCATSTRARRCSQAARPAPPASSATATPRAL